MNNQTDNHKSNQNNLNTSPTQDLIGNGSITNICVLQEKKLGWRAESLGQRAETDGQGMIVEDRWSRAISLESNHLDNVQP